MKDQKLLLHDYISLCLLSFFGSGYLPKMPGTFGSLATIPLILFLSWLEIQIFSLVIIILLLTLVSCVVAERMQKKLHVHDPGWIVIDEVIGMLLTWLFVFPAVSWKSLLAVFILFRFFDIIKFYPASWFDKKITHGAGTILDDVVSGIYAGICLIPLNYFNLIN